MTTRRDWVVTFLGHWIVLLGLLMLTSAASTRVAGQPPQPSRRQILDRQRILMPAEFTKGRLDQLAAEYLRQHRGKYSLLRVTFALNEGDVFRSRLSAVGGVIENHDLRRTLVTIARNGISTSPIARLMATPRGALLSLRLPTRLEECLVEGRDPTRFVLDGADYRLLHFIHQPNLPLGRHRSYASLKLYFFGEKPSEKAGIHFVREFRRITGVRFTMVDIRPDVWFTEWDYPDVYPYVERVVLPDPKTYDPRARLLCNMSTGTPACSWGR